MSSLSPAVVISAQGDPAVEGDARVAATWRRVITVVGLLGLTCAVYAPTLHNGFLPLGFDDGLILDTPSVRNLSWHGVGEMFTTFNHAHYVPLALLSLALDVHVWGLDPTAIHATNIALHALAGVLVWIFLRRLVGAEHIAALAAAIFIVHPLQMEAVTVAVQRKTVLAGACFFLTLVLYQQWRTDGRRWLYRAAVVAFVAAALSKPAVMPLPVLLLLYDYHCGHRWTQWTDTSPFFAIAVAAGVAGVAAHAAVGAVHAPHSGTFVGHLLMVSRVTVEYAVALLLPLNLSPVYYYPAAGVYNPVSILAFVLVVGVILYVSVFRVRYRWAFFCLWWCLLTLAPESNLIPLAQLRADRFLYLAMMGFGLWVALGCVRLDQHGPVFGVRHVGTAVVGPFLVGLWAILCYASAPMWRDDVSAWTRVVERHPWCAVAHTMLGRAHFENDELADAERDLTSALRLSERAGNAHLYLARVYAAQGQPEPALQSLQRFLALTPGDPEGVQLLADLSRWAAP